MLPAFALSFVVVPTMPLVEDGVMVLVAVTVVNRPVDAVVAPIVVPFIVPPVTATADAPCVAMEPRPRADCAVA